MRSYPFLAIIFVPFFVVSTAIMAFEPSTSDEGDTLKGYLKLYDELIHLEPDPDSFMAVENLNFHRDVGKFQLTKGGIFFCKPVWGRVCAAVFLGEGVFQFSPPTQIEKEHLYRFYEEYDMVEDFDFLFMMFTDSTLEELKGKSDLSNNTDFKEYKTGIDYALEYMGKKKEKGFNYEMVKSLFDGEQNNLFYSHFSSKKLRPMFFVINPYDEEEVHFMRREEGEAVGYTRETINQFHLQEDYRSGMDLSDENNLTLDVESYRINCNIEGNLDFSAVADIRFISLAERQQWIYFWLFPELDVDSVFAMDGQKLTFFKEKKNPLVWIECPDSLAKGQAYQVTIHYHGDLIQKEVNWIYSRSNLFWFPRHGLRDKATFDFTFKTPLNYQFVCVGEQQEADTLDKIATTRWIVSNPTRNATFHIGVYDQFNAISDSLPTITVFSAEAAHDDMARNTGIFFSRNMNEDVGYDVARSISFFGDVFGALPKTDFHVVEIPGLHAQSFPGLILLSWETFFQRNKEGYNQIVRGHEVAHQWWGIGVDFKTYHDQWLSEGISQFCGLWYMQHVIDDQKKFYDILKKLREGILNNRNYLFTKGQQAGPIWLGYRTNSIATSGDYDLIIYQKGALVMHMLRMMMMNLKTKSDGAFTAMMHDFFETYKDQSASTGDFQKVIEKHYGQDMQWFFDQWIYGIEIPKYIYSYKIDKSDDGKYSVRLRVMQEEVVENFQMPVLLKMKFGKDDERLERVLVKGKASEFEFTDLDKKPKDIEFNALESVLCKADKKGWK